MKNNKYIIDNKKLMKEWNYEKNIGVDVSKITCGTNQKVWWICKYGHEWETAVNVRTAGSNCPYCSNRKILKGFNDLATTNPDLAKEWDYSKNIFFPTEVSSGSKKCVWWVCKNGHSYQSIISNRNLLGNNCPYCSNQKLLKGFNDLATTNPNLAEEWNYSKNGDLKPTDVIGGKKKVWWRCSRGHEWEAAIDTRKRNNCNSGCPYCSNQKVLIGYNDLATTNPELAKEWDYSKNKDINPTDIVSGSNKKVWWVCKNGHEWNATISSRNFGKGCPYCSNQKLLKGFNDLATTNPELAKEWHPNKNNNLKPDEIIFGTPRKVWWLCKNGHEWEAKVNSRVLGRGCPYCNLESHSSIPEQIIYTALKQIYNDTTNRFKLDGKVEIDIFIPQKSIGIEYDGIYFHSKNNAKMKEENKNLYLTSRGIHLIRVKESNENNFKIEKGIYIIYCKVNRNYEYMQGVLKQLNKIINDICNENFILDFNIEDNMIKILEDYEFLKKENSLESLFPEVSKEWNYEKNGKLIPENVNAGSGKKVWWVCKNGHEWKSSICNRTSIGRNCPYCKNKKLLKGLNDLATVNPELAKEWNYEKNGTLKPNQVTYGSGKKVWWICSKGHEWQDSVSHRRSGRNCPYCTNHKLLRGYNDLATVNPELAKEWHPNKNGILTPSDVKGNSSKKVWWLCSNGHSYETSILNRNSGKGCSICGSNK